MRVLLWALVCLTVTPAGAQTTFFSETFDGAMAPAMPGSVISADANWTSSDASSSPGSGLNNGVHTGSSPGNMVLGPIDLSAALDATLSYWARRTSSYSADSLFVRAGTDGATFETLLFGGGLPASASTWEEILVTIPSQLLGAESVFLRFEGRGGSSSGSNMRIDDVLIEGTADPSAMETGFGFEAASITWNTPSSTLDLGLDLEWPGPDSMQGLQFDLSWDAAVISVDSISLGASAGSATDWIVSSNLTTGSGSVALVHLGANGHPPGPYSSFLALHVSAATTVTTGIESVISISNLLAATTAPDGSELSLPDGHRSLTITLQPALASVDFSSESLDFGSVTAGDSALVQIDVSNPTGSAPLELAWTPTAGGPLNPVPTLPASIPLGESATLTMWLRPRLEDGGLQSGAITISHNTASGATDLSWAALVTGGRGDADGDGAFDVADVVASLDGTVDSGLIPADELPRHDVFPFPDGDGALDIRDITVAIQAILRDQWPDGSDLPVPPASPAGKGQSLPLVLVGDSLWAASPVPLRGFQLSFAGATDVVAAHTTASKGANKGASQGASISTWRDPDSNELRLISLAGAQDSFEPGPQLVAVFARASHTAQFNTPIALNSGMAVDAAGAKIPLSLRVADEIPAVPQPDLSTFGVYPNPLPLGTDLKLSLPVASISSVALFNPLGQRLWYSREVVRTIPGSLFRVPGTYFVRITASTSSGGYDSVLPSGTRAVIVVR